MIVKEFENNLFIPEIAKYIQAGHTVTMKVKGCSMHPFIDNGRDKVVLKSFDQYQIGDVVLAKVDDGRFVLHRIVKMEDNRMTLRGDGNVVGVETCPTDSVIAKAIGFIRKGRDKMDATDGWKWKIYSFLWLRLSFMRRWLLAFYRRIWLKLVK